MCEALAARETEGDQKAKKEKLEQMLKKKVNSLRHKDGDGRHTHAPAYRPTRYAVVSSSLVHAGRVIAAV